MGVCLMENLLMRLIGLKIEKLYGIYDYNVKFNDDVTFIYGSNGSGKTTVLNILGGMDTASSGEVWVDGNNVAEYSNKELTRYRRDDIGFVFQFYNLVQNLTAKENVELASQICKNPLKAEDVLLSLIHI